MYLDNLTYDETNSFIDDDNFSFFWLPLEIHLFFLTVIFLFGVIGNVFVIIICLNNETFRTYNMYIISLACLDIIACFTFAPQFPLFHWYKIQQWKGEPVYVYGFITNWWFVACAYNGHLACMAVDRAKAIFQSIFYRQSKLEVGLKIAVVYITSLLVTTITIFILVFSKSAEMAKKILVVLGSTITSHTLTTLIICYSSILFKMCKSMNRIKDITSAKHDASIETKNNQYNR